MLYGRHGLACTAFVLDESTEGWTGRPRVRHVRGWRHSVRGGEVPRDQGPELQGYKLHCNQQQACEYEPTIDDGRPTWVWVPPGSFTMGSDPQRHFEVAEKHYFEDLGVRGALLGSRPQDVSKVVENAVLSRLLVDGWTITTGDVDGRKIDFVANRGRERLYIQACYLLADPATRARELRSLLDIDDNQPKDLVSLDPLPQDERGIAHLHLRDFLRDGWRR